MELCHDDWVTISFGADPVRAEVADLLSRMDTGEVVDKSHERKHVDLKEEVGRRDRSGAVVPGTPENEPAARKIAGEAAFMANTPGGGALIVGVADDGALVGSDLDAE